MTALLEANPRDAGEGKLMPGLTWRSAGTERVSHVSHRAPRGAPFTGRPQNGGRENWQNCFADFTWSTCLECVCGVCAQRVVSHSAGWSSHTGYSSTFLLLYYSDKRSVRACVCARAHMYVFKRELEGERERRIQTQSILESVNMIFLVFGDVKV